MKINWYNYWEFKNIFRILIKIVSNIKIIHNSFNNRNMWKDKFNKKLQENNKYWLNKYNNNKIYNINQNKIITNKR